MKWVIFIGLLLSVTAVSIFGTITYQSKAQLKQKAANLAMFDKLYSCTIHQGTDKENPKGMTCNEKNCVSRYNDAVKVNFIMCCQNNNSGICGVSLQGNGRILYDLISTWDKTNIEDLK